MLRALGTELDSPGLFPGLGSNEVGSTTESLPVVLKILVCTPLASDGVLSFGVEIVFGKVPGWVSVSPEDKSALVLLWN